MRLVATLAAAAGILLMGAVTSNAEGVDEIDPDVAARLYNPEMLDPAQPVGASPLREFKAKNPPPWKIGYASSYAGNTWRANAMDYLQNVVIPKYKELGLISEVIVTQSNLNDSTQIQQMRQLVDQGVDAIFVCCSNPTALNQTVQYAYDKGVPTFSLTGYLTAPTAINSSLLISFTTQPIAWLDSPGMMDLIAASSRCNSNCFSCWTVRLAVRFVLSRSIVCCNKPVR